jgi:hypothetical protein
MVKHKVYCLIISLVILFTISNAFSQNTNASTNLAGQVGAGTPCPGATNWLIDQFSLKVTMFSPETFTAINNFVVSGTYTAADIVNYKLWTTDFSVFGGGSLVLLATLGSSGPGTKTFSGFSKSLPGGGSTPRYFWITADFAAGATPGHTLTVNLMTAGMFAVTGGGVTTGPTWQAAGTQTICVPAPIELLYFKGINDGKTNKLEWASATEVNNELYSIERSFNGIDFEVIQQIPGAGNSDIPLYYSHDDDNCCTGTVYYRLKQTDYDGTSKYEGGLISINSETEEDPVWNYNNAVQELSILNINSKHSYALLDIQGRTVKSGELLPGNASISTSGLSPGMYLLHLSSRNGSIVKKIILD